jgi:di/tricarboxylate transporter
MLGGSMGADHDADRSQHPRSPAQEYHRFPAGCVTPVVAVAAGVLAVPGLIPGTGVFFSEHEDIDWNVIFLPLRMMITVGIIKQTGLFDYLGIRAAKLSKGRPYPLMVLLMAITALASPCSWPSSSGSACIPSFTSSPRSSRRPGRD